MLTPCAQSDLTPETQEARSLFHAQDTLSIRWLDSGRIALYNKSQTLFAIADTLEDIRNATEHLRILASAKRQQAEADRLNLLRRAEQAKILDALEIEI